MFHLVRGRNQRIGYFLRGARAFAPKRTLTALMRFMMGLLFTTYERTIAGIQGAVADAPSPTAMRAFVRSSPLASKLSRIVDWKTGQNVRKALRMATGHRGPIIFAIDSTFKGTLSRRARDLFRPGKGKRVGQHIFVCGLLLFPDGRRLPLRLRQKRRGKGQPSQVDLAVDLIEEAAGHLGGHEVVVVADAFFFAKKVLRAVKAAGFHYVIACKGNTVLRDGANLQTLSGKIRLHGQCVTLPSSKGERSKRFSVARRDYALRCGGTQTVVFSRLYRKRRARLKFLVSDLHDAKTAEIVRLYARRWDIELFFRDAKLYLGLDDYRVTGERAPSNIAMLVVLTYQFLHWQGTTCGPPSSTLTRIRAFGDELDADNVAAIVRAFVTRHGPSRILNLLREVRCAHAS